MMIQEFEERTGFHPSMDLYAEIEKAYMESTLDKDTFCSDYKMNKNGIAEAIARRTTIAAISASRRAEKETSSKIADLEKEIASLKRDLDRELEWNPSSGTGTWMSEDRYQHLKSSGKVMSEQDAIEFIAEECGFAADKIHIVRSVATYEVNKYRQLRKAASYEREPVYESTDWNYVRFDCASFMYEYENGELRFYCC